MNKVNQLMIVQWIVQSVRECALHPVTIVTIAIPAAAVAEEVSWQDIEEEVSTATGKQTKHITMTITTQLVGELEWRHTKKRRKRKGIVARCISALII